MGSSQEKKILIGGLMFGTKNGHAENKAVDHLSLLQLQHFTKKICSKRVQHYGFIPQAAQAGVAIESGVDEGVGKILGLGKVLDGVVLLPVVHICPQQEPE